MAASVFIDGQAGTTGLRIRVLLRPRRDLDVLEIDAQQRKDPAARRALFERADVALLCLPADAAREAIALCADSDARIVDASTVPPEYSSDLTPAGVSSRITAAIAIVERWW